MADVPAKKVDGVPAELAQSSKYEILGKLGQGGMGAVYKARNLFLDRIVALKVMTPEVLRGSQARSRFLKEMKAVGQLEHRNIATAYDADQVGELLVLVMEFVDGISLDRLVARKGPLPISFACQCAEQAARGLHHAHEKGMVHRDVKPSNLMLTRADRTVKILDFGLVQLPDSAQRGQTLLQTFMGTPDYVPPEQATDARGADRRADVYGLGCTLYFLLAARPPFVEDSPLSTILAHVEKEPPPLSALRPETPAELWAVIARMLAKDPAQRFQTAQEVALALEPFLEPGGKREQTSLPPLPPSTNSLAELTLTPPPAKPRKAPPRRPLLLIAAGVFGLLAVLLFGLTRWLSTPEQPRRTTRPSTAGEKRASEKVPVSVPAAFRDRLDSNRLKLVEARGGNARTERAVADGLRFLALHQNEQGYWSLHEFHKDARTAPLPGGTIVPDMTEPMTNRNNNTAGTAFGLLAFLGAGITPRSMGPSPGADYRVGVGKAIDYLIANQSRQGNDRGFFGGDMYTQGLATLAMCEAYALTGDPRLEASAQLGINYIVNAQDVAGGWRYFPRQPGDTSVTSWQLAALKAGQLAGLEVPRVAFARVTRFIDSCENNGTGGYSYIPGTAETISMTAIGAQARLWLGVNPRNTSVLRSVARIRNTPPGAGPLYYEFYATQVMYHRGGDDWQFWNLGPKGKVKSGMRDRLIDRQDSSTGIYAGQAGSFAGYEEVGGRLGATALSLLLLEIYYRYPPASEQGP